MGQSVGIDLVPGEQPLHRQIFDQLAGRIASGTFPPGFRLPPIRDLAAECGAHRNTVSRAYADLEAAGFVHSHVGRGTFVATPLATGRPLPVTPSAAGTMLPWSQLLSRAARSESLERAQRFPAAKRDVINLSRMQPSTDLLPHQQFRRCLDFVLRKHGPKAFGYSPPEGLPQLRDNIAALLGREGIPARAEDLVVTTGSAQALDLVTRALVDPGDAVLLDAISYHGAIALFQTSGAKLVTVGSDGQGPDLGALGRVERQSAKLLYCMPNCHNPVGSMISAERRQALVRWSEASGVPLVEDDYGAGLQLDATPPPPALRTLSGDVIYLSTFSKRLLPGLRIGFIAAPPPLRPALTALKKVSDLGCSPLIQLALAEFLERGYLEAHLQKTVPEYRKRRDAMSEAIRRYLPSEIRFSVPAHGVVLWLQLPGDIAVEPLYHAALDAGVQVSPGALWSVDSGPVNGLRLVFCNEPPARIADGVRRLGKILEQQRSRRGHGAGLASVDCV